MKLFLISSLLLVLVQTTTTTANNNNDDLSVFRKVPISSSSTSKVVLEEEEPTQIITTTNNDDNEKPQPKNKVEACWRDAKARGVGHIPEKDDKDNKRECKKDEDKSGGLCYPKCEDKMVGLGPICWEDCEKVKYHSAGLLFCCVDDQTCADLVLDIGKQLPQAIVKFALDIAVNPSNIVKILHDFRDLVKDSAKLALPMCSDVKDTTPNQFIDVEIA
jgi:hypothetical protein